MPKSNIKKLLLWPVVTAIGLNFFWASAAKAICPICTVAVGAGLEISEWLGIDDVVTSLWIGGLTVSLILWTIDWLERKKKTFAYYRLITTLAYYFVVVASLFYADSLNKPWNKLWGVDKIVLGTIIGSLIFWGAGNLHFYLKKRNNDKVYFPFQKVVIPVGSLIFISLIFYFITK